MASNKRKKKDGDEAGDYVFVLSLISVNHSLNYKPQQSNVGVFSSKAAASAAAGSISSGYGTFDRAMAMDFSDNFVDNRGEDAPDYGVLLQIGSSEVGEGDYVKLIIEKFPLNHGSTTAAATTTTTTAAASTTTDECTSNDITTANIQKRKKNNETKTRKIDETALMVLMEAVMQPAEHKRVTQKIQTLVQKMESEAAPLQNTRDHIFGRNVQPENLFEVHAGDFWGMFDTRGYMRAHLALADEIHDKIAVPYDTQVASEAVLCHYQEMLRLCSSDNLGLRYRFPFLLLHLNRDDDAFCFIEHWIKDDDEDEDEEVDAVGDEDDDDDGCTPREKLHKTSKQGDWIYGHKKDSRFLDIFQVCSNAKFEYVCLPLLVALACIKMRIIGMPSTIDATKNEQKKQLIRILQLINKRNPTMLPALVHPAPLLSQKPPNYMSPGTPSECYSIVADASRIWNSIPGALKRLQKQFGEKPAYKTNLDY